MLPSHEAHIRPVAMKKSSAHLWKDTNAFARGVDLASFGYQDVAKWHEGKAAIAQSGDDCKKGTWVFFRSAQASLHSHLSLL
jgi:hypothetical protein